MLGGAHVDEQLVDLVQHLGNAGVGPVDLVDHQDDGQVESQRLAQHETGLGQRPLAGVDQQQDAVDHGEAPLHLAAEVGVAGGVDDVDLDAAVAHRGVLGQDGDALFPLQVVGVQDPLDDGLVVAEGARLAEHGVDQRRLAVVDVGHDGDVAEVFTDGVHDHHINLGKGKGAGPGHVEPRQRGRCPATPLARPQDAFNSTHDCTGLQAPSRPRWPRRRSAKRNERVAWAALGRHEVDRLPVS